MRAGVIIIDNDNNILLIHRFFQGREYYVIPGGGVEQGETVEQAAIREAQEETSLEVVLTTKVFEFYNEFDKRKNVFFLVKQFTGTPKLGGPEAQRNSPEDRYILEWHPIKNLGTLNLVPKEVGVEIVKLFS